MEEALEKEELENKLETSLGGDEVTTLKKTASTKSLSSLPLNVERWWATNILKGLNPIYNGHRFAFVPNLSITVLHTLNVLYPYHKFVLLLLKSLYFLVLKHIYFVLSLVISAAVAPRLKDGLKSSSLILSFGLFSISTLAVYPPPKESKKPAMFSKEVQVLSDMVSKRLDNVDQGNMIVESLKPKVPHPLHVGMLSFLVTLQLAYFLRRKTGPLYNALKK
jgi:hypothetical protein